MINEDLYREICKTVLKKHYNSFREDIKDGFFYNTPTQAEKRLLDMIRNFRAEMEQQVPVPHTDSNAQVLKEQILGEYIQIGRKYGNRVKKRRGLV